MFQKLILLTIIGSFFQGPVSQYSGQYKSKNCIKLIRTQDSLTPSKIDSLKWVMYSMNYYKKATHYKNSSLPEISVLECEIKFKGIDQSRPDTLIYDFFFYKDEESNVYDPKDFYFSGIGYSYKTKNTFPMLSYAYPSFATNADTCRFFFDKREKDFIKYLQQYNGVMTPWLHKEAIKRRVIR